MKSKVGILAAGLAASLALNGHAVPIAWVDWTSAVNGNAGSAEGLLTADGTSVGVHFTGPLGFSQTDNTGMNFFIEPIPSMRAYTSAAVDNAPAAADVIGITGGTGATYTFNFDMPLIDPVLAIVSLGNPSLLATYRFDAPFAVLSSGYGFWGIGPTPLTDLGGNVLAGREASGVVRFTGTFSSLSFTAPVADRDQRFTLGAAGIANVVPEPGILFAIGFILLTGITMRRTRRI
jgi:hypothetical protein